MSSQSSAQEILESVKRFIFILLEDMFFNRSDSYYYSRPISYRSYNPRLTKKEVLPFSDPDTDKVLNFFKQNNVTVDNLGGLSRGIRFGDLEVGKRVYNHNSRLYYADSEYFIHQWKPTNDLGKQHPTGTHYTTKDINELLAKLQKVLADQRRTYK
jgi:hypothetical protein